MRKKQVLCGYAWLLEYVPRNASPLEYEGFIQLPFSLQVSVSFLAKAKLE